MRGLSEPSGEPSARRRLKQQPDRPFDPSSDPAPQGHLLPQGEKEPHQAAPSHSAATAACARSDARLSHPTRPSASSAAFSTA